MQRYRHNTITALIFRVEQSVYEDLILCAVTIIVGALLHSDSNFMCVLQFENIGLRK